ncbi:MAG: hypothetical protein QXJ25_02770 [Candidatus Aenigmatarchaeota archaeon]
MKMRKGISAWILVIGGIILGMIIFFAGIYISIQTIKINEKQAALSEINTLYEKIERTCLVGGIGETYYYKISLPESIRAVYVSNYSDEEPPDKVSVLISENKIGLGKYFCYQFFNEAPNCRKISCNTFMTYIGTPSMKEDLLSLLARVAGERPRYNYTIIINKTFFDTVIAVTKLVEIPITTTTI